MKVVRYTDGSVSVELKPHELPSILEDMRPPTPETSPEYDVLYAKLVLARADRLS